MPLQPTKIKQIFQKTSNLRIGVIGDFAVDFYYAINQQTHEFSVETSKEVFWGSKPITSLGAAGNVVQNLAALGVENIQVFGCIGNDIFGREMKHLFQNINVDTTFLKGLSSGWDTCTYTKPMSVNGEENRLDFGTNNALSEEIFKQILLDLESALPNLNVLIINQQFPNPLLTPQRIQQLNSVLEKFPDCLFVADLRAYGLHIKNIILKVNTEELARLVGVLEIEEANEIACIMYGKALLKQIGGSLVITRGEHGILYISSDKTQSVEALKLNTKLDTVGAGDTVVAAFSASRGTGATIKESLEIANLAAAVTVQKLHQTGTATLEEILEQNLN
ncbi:Bifunctional protein HldE [Emticicia aquatica]|uniref:Bifunctional protein HldE n=1 Tax=Emticicia aquatica TaxID=1681835 RepID=A0ABN8EWH9_9BACT|nr:PfkB family carbohydrate kinase [Emticicia aquatica]CAH0996128.1 Bifunctional protein HldE [Emticicia aquatica]